MISYQIAFSFIRGKDLVRKRINIDAAYLGQAIELMYETYGYMWIHKVAGMTKQDVAAWLRIWDLTLLAEVDYDLA